MIVPAISVVNLTPSVTAWASPESAVVGVIALPHSEQGQDTLTEVPAVGVSRLALSSTARDLIVVEGLPLATHV